MPRGAKPPDHAPTTPLPDGVMAAANTDRTQVDPLIGMRPLGQYEIERKIGDGGYGSVYLATQIGVSRRAVIKVLAAQTREDREVVLQRFQREAKVLAALDSQHLVRLYNIGELETGQPFFAMEYGGDVTLAEEIERHKRLRPDRALLIAAQICEALQEAHSHGVVHRDLKPQNILLGRKDGQDWVKVVDVGIAKLLDSAAVDEGGARLTGTGMVIGTAAYFSPEQSHGVAVDGRSDLYTLGIVLYEMLSGRLPVRGDTPVDFVRAHLMDPPTPLATQGVQVPAHLEALVMKALAKKPADRFQSAAAMRDAILDARARLREPEPKKKRRRSLKLLAGGGALLLLAGLAVDLGSSRPSGEPTGKGAVVLEATPDGADIFLDGKLVTPGRHRVRAGKHHLVVKAQGFADHEQDIQVAPKQTVPINITLVEAAAP
jgi:serine/threonine protein kinase